ncbi:MAG: UbiA family prenyltransferase, partial [Fulvivirga sp.]
SGFDLIYALQDESFDRKMSLHSIPVAIGGKGTLILSTLFHGITAALILWVSLKAEANFLFWTGSIIFIALLTYQHLIVKPNDLSKVNRAFFTTNGIASLIFSIFVISSFYLN